MMYCCGLKTLENFLSVLLWLDLFAKWPTPFTSKLIRQNLPLSIPFLFLLHHPVVQLLLFLTYLMVVLCWMFLSSAIPLQDLVCNWMYQWPVCDPDLLDDNDPWEDSVFWLIGLSDWESKLRERTRERKEFRRQVCIINIFNIREDTYKHHIWHRMILLSKVPFLAFMGPVEIEHPHKSGTTTLKTLL